MIEIRHDLPLNKPHRGSKAEAPVEVHYEAQTEGKTVAKGKGNSILYGFLAGLWLNAGSFLGFPMPTQPHRNSTGISVYGKIDDVVEANGTVRLLINTGSSTFYLVNNFYWVTRVPGTNIGGLYRVKEVVNNQYIDIVDPDTLDDIQLVGTPDLSVHQPHATRLERASDLPNTAFRANNSLRATSLVLGLSYGQPQDVSLVMQWVDNAHTGILSPSSMITGAPVIGDNESYIQFTRDFTNNTDNEISINAICLPGYVGNEDIYPLAIDAVNIGVPAGQTVTVNYRIRISNDASGGLLWQFTELLYRQLAQESRESRNIFNENRTKNQNSIQFFMHGSGANVLDADDRSRTNTPGMSANSLATNGYLLGPQVGTGTADVINTNIDLDERILPGTGSGELVMYGAHVTPMVIDEDSGEAYFDVERAFENRSGSAISVTETGLNCAGDDTSGAPMRPDTHCIARHRLATAVSVPDGEMLRLTYRMKVVV